MASRFFTFHVVHSCKNSMNVRKTEYVLNINAILTFHHYCHLDAFRVCETTVSHLWNARSTFVRQACRICETASADVLSKVKK